MTLTARQLYFEAVKVGDELPPLVKPPVDRLQIARYAGAAQDWNPLSIDEPFARNAGFPSALAPAMIAMGFVAELAVEWVRGARLRRFQARFVKIIWPGDVLTARGRVVDRRFEPGGRYAIDVEVWAENQRGELVVRGVAGFQLYYSAEDEARQRAGQPALQVTPEEEEARLAKLSRAQPPRPAPAGRPLAPPKPLAPPARPAAPAAPARPAAQVVPQRPPAPAARPAAGRPPPAPAPARPAAVASRTAATPARPAMPAPSAITPARPASAARPSQPAHPARPPPAPARPAATAPAPRRPATPARPPIRPAPARSAAPARGAAKPPAAAKPKAAARPAAGKAKVARPHAAKRSARKEKAASARARTPARKPAGKKRR